MKTWTIYIKYTIVKAELTKIYNWETVLIKLVMIIN